MKNKATEIKLMLVGESNVGKSSIFNRFINDEFPENIDASTGVEFKIKSFKYKKKEYSLYLFDTAGQKRFRSNIEGYYKMVKGVFIVFDLTNKDSLDKVADWVDTIQNKCKEPKIILLGNKKDLKKRMKEEFLKEKLADLRNKFKYYEISAKTNQNINLAIETMIDLIENKNPECNIKDNLEDTEEKTKINVDEQSGVNIKENTKGNVNDNSTGNANEQPKKKCCPCSNGCS